MKATSIVRGIIGKGKQEEGGSTKTEAERRKRAEIEEKSKYMGGVENLGEIEKWYAGLDAGWCEWFVGFVEGDGGLHFFDYSGRRRGTDVIIDFSITQSTWNKELLEEIREKLGFGAVAINDKKGMTHQYITRSRREIMKVIYILNGMLQLSKRKAQLAEFVERYNKHFGHNIVVAPSKDLIALDRGWLTGMTEAEGCFTVTLQQPTAGRIARAEAGAKKKREKAEKKLEESKTEKERAKAARRIAESNEEKSLSYQVMVRYVITQKDEEAVLKTIAEVLGGKVSGKNMTVQLTAADTVIEYLSRYPMRGKKREAYEIWCNIRKMALAKLHLTGELEKIRVEAEKLKKLNGNKGDLVKLAETEQEES